MRNAWAIFFDACHEHSFIGRRLLHKFRVDVLRNGRSVVTGCLHPMLSAVVANAVGKVACTAVV